MDEKDRKICYRVAGRPATAGVLSAQLRESLRQKLPPLPKALFPKFAHRASYYKHCKATLMCALSPLWRGSRAALKAKLRAILHPRRHDLRFLGGLVRACAVSGAMGVFVLTANMQVANADACKIEFAPPPTHPDNPLDRIGLDDARHSVFADLDDDGDLDILSGSSSYILFVFPANGSLEYFKNTGTSSNPSFTQQTDSDYPLDRLDFFDYTGSAIADVDDDGDLDVFVMGTELIYDSCNIYGICTSHVEPISGYLQNIGTASTPVFAELIGSTNPFDGINVAGNNGYPALVDVDNDGDLDLFVGDDIGSIKFYQNTGNATLPVFIEQTGNLNPFNGVNLGYDSAPSFVDIDADGDMDAFINGIYSSIHYFQNMGTINVPQFVEQLGAPSPIFGLDRWGISNFSFGDIDDDGDFDTINGNSFIENIGTNIAPAFILHNESNDPFNQIQTRYEKNLSFSDIDGDADLDIFIGSRSGYVRYYENIGISTNPIFSERTDALNPFDGVSVGSQSTPAFCDIDNDGDLDAFIGEWEGNINFFQNVGVPSAPIFTHQVGILNPFDGIDLGRQSTPAFCDIDADGDWDAFVGNWLGDINFFQNNGSPTTPILTQQAGSLNPFDGIEVGNLVVPTFIDVDGDGDKDSFIGEHDGNINYFQNTGSSANPNFILQIGVLNPLSGVSVSFYSTPALTDVDGDGDLDVFVGEYLGRYVYIQNYSYFQPDCLKHSADQDQDYVIDLSEILRLVQFYNITTFHCDPAGEDGYNPGPGAKGCSPHSADYNPQDWAIDLAELVRVIQLYNLGEYFACPGVGEDGFCPGAP